jgi:uncharacterized protein YqgV (UPF0045/DUF77 family)
MEGLLNEESLREEGGKNNQILLLINNSKKKLINIIEEYIDNNCVEFKKEAMKTLFEEKISNLAEKMSEGRRKVSDSNYFLNNPGNGSNKDNKSNISSVSNKINNYSNSNTSISFSK